MSWDDPSKMPIYQVQLETRYRIIGYEVATNNHDAIDLAKAHLCSVFELQKGEDYIHVGGYSEIGYHELGDSLILETKILRS